MYAIKQDMTKQIQFGKLIFTAFTTALLLLSQLVGAASLNDIRVWNAPDHTRIVLDLDQVPNFREFRVGNPSRYVVDLPGFTLGAVKSIDATKSGPYLNGIRVGMPDPKKARLVLDVNQEVKVKTLLLAPVQNFKHRLVLDVYPKNPGAVVKAPAKQPTQTAKVTPDKKTIPPKSAKAANQPFIIAIDAGHGGEDTGARGRRTREKDVVLQIAKRLQKKINAQKGMKAILTRKGDYFVSLRDRTLNARKAGAKLFISIHADGFKKNSARGSSVYALSLRGATSETARWLANKENAADLAGGVNISTRDNDLARTLLDLSMTGTQNESIVFAKSVFSELKKIGKTHSNSVEKAGFVVLKSPDIPSILVETAFITNPKEEKLLRSAAYQEKLANAILIGAKKYMKNSNYFASLKN